MPETVPVDGWHRQPPEHVNVTGGVRVVHPALQVQLVTAALPAGELEFDGQAVQAADPVDALYFPAAHAVHVLDVDPLLQEATKPE